MTMLNARQQLARRLADELGRFEDVWITSPMPLRDGEKLRLQVLDRSRNEIIQIARDLGHEMIFVSVLPRICATGLAAACLYEIYFEPERQVVQDDRVKGEIGKTKRSHETEELLKYVWGKK